MLKFNCPESGCAHGAEEKGFCPKHGKELTDGKTESVDPSVSKLLEQIGTIVEDKVRDTVKEYNLDGNGKSMHSKMPSTRQEKYDYVKGLLNQKDKETFESIANEEKKTEYLAKARIAHFFKAAAAFTLTKDPEHLANLKALAEGTDGVGGYLTPSEFRAELVRDLQDKPVLRNLVTVIPMSSDYLELPTLVSDVKTSWGSENTAISTTTARFSQLTFAPKRLNTFLYTSRELVADAAIPVVQLITRLFIEAIGREEDRVIVNGSGNGQPKGLLQETFGGIDNANVDANLPDNIVKLTYRLGTSYRPNARWLINSLSLGDIRSRRTTAGDFIFKNSANEGEPGRLAGFPVVEQNDMPLDTMLFGDLSYYYLADREQISVETTTEGAGTFEKHQVAIKVVERIDGKTALTNAFKALTNCGID